MMASMQLGGWNNGKNLSQFLLDTSDGGGGDSGDAAKSAASPPADATVETSTILTIESTACADLTDRGSRMHPNIRPVQWCTHKILPKTGATDIPYQSLRPHTIVPFSP